MSKLNTDGPGVSGIAIIAILIAVLAILLGPRMVFLFNVFIGALLISGVFYLIKVSMEAKKEKAFEKSTEGYVYKHMRQCKSQIDKNNQEVVEIERNIDDLRAKINPKLQMSEQTQKETDRILGAFHQELQLRHAKIEFYKTCLKKLNTIDYNHKMSQELAAKQQKLNELQEDHYEDIAHMETLKSDVAYDQSYLTSIENLTLRMSGSNSIKAVENLQLELVEITKELRRI